MAKDETNPEEFKKRFENMNTNEIDTRIRELKEKFKKDYELVIKY